MSTLKHELPDLPYPKNALDPILSAETLEFHYGKHHRAYVNKLNELIPGTEFAEMPLEDIIRKASGPIFNNAAQIWNHTFYWSSLSPEKKGPKGEILKALDRDFGSFDQFSQLFQKAAIGQFGSGWAWLVQNADGKLAITSTSNADTPLRQGTKALLTVDVWEHAYYIDYRNDRAKYAQTLIQLLNWDFAEKNLQKH